jgi:hypothetical protein
LFIMNLPFVCLPSLRGAKITALTGRVSASR